MSTQCTTHHHACDCREAKFDRIQRTLNWLYDHSPLAIWSGHVNGEPRVEIIKTDLDAEIVRENGAWVVLGGGATLVEAVANAEENT